MKLFRSTALVAGLVACPAFSLAVGFNFTFDSNNQGWTKGDFGNGFANITVNSNGPATFASQSGNGYLLGSDHGSYAYHFSPDLGGNQGALFGQLLQFDFRSASGAGNLPTVVLMSSTGFLVREIAVAATPGFVAYSLRMDTSETWYFNSSPYYNGAGAVVANASQIQSILNDLRHVGITTDIASGGDTTWTDNVRAVPEPATMTALAAGFALIARRRRK